MAKIKKECVFTKSIILRGDSELKYCIDVQCETHKAKWFATCNSLDRCEDVLNNFPLIGGGICMRTETGFEAYKITTDCIIGCIQDTLVKKR